MLPLPLIQKEQSTMSLFNKSNSGASRSKNLAASLAASSGIENHEGGVAFEYGPYERLVLTVATSLLTPQDSFYEKHDEKVKKLDDAIEEVLQIDPLFILQTAAYARNELYLRSVPMYLVSKYANSNANLPDTRKYLDMIVQRPDEITELIALSQMGIEKGTRQKHSQFILKGIRNAFESFDAGILAKYNGRYSMVKLKDAMALVHPRPPAGMEEAYEGILSGELKRDNDQWWIKKMHKGTVNSEAESPEEMTVDDWNISFNKMGYLGVLQNLTKLIDGGVDPDAIYKRLANEQAVLKAKVFPFRFITAAQAIRQVRYHGNSKIVYPNSMYSTVLNGIYAGLEASGNVVPKMPGTTLVLVDVSGSMTGNYLKTNKNKKYTGSTIGDITCSQAATLMAAIYAKNNLKNTSIVLFAEDFQQIDVDENRGILQMANDLAAVNNPVVEPGKPWYYGSCPLGGATYTHKPIEHIVKERLKFDRILLFSDMQCYSYHGLSHSALHAATLEYQQKVNPDVKLYSVDLAGYAQAVYPDNMKNTVFLGGWSEQTLKFIELYESDATTMIDHIKTI
jgi:hypothetical protein